MRCERSRDAWNDYIKIRANPYVVHPSIIHADYGPQFRSDEWRIYRAECNIQIHTSGVQSHNSLGVGERYHEYLRQMYRKVEAEHKNMNLEYLLPLALDAMNVASGKNGLSHDC